MTYSGTYQRNIGILTEQEQDLLRQSHVFVAGAGGAGGMFVALLARSGIGEISLMDPGVFDEPDLNRQYGAMRTNLGKNKAIATAEILSDIAPYAKINVISDKLVEHKLIDRIKDCDLVIDAIDLSDFQYKAILARIARKENKYNLTAPMPDFGSVMIIFDPSGMTFEEFTGCKRYPPLPILPENGMSSAAVRKAAIPQENVADIPFLSSASTIVGSVALGGALVATETVLILTRKRALKDIIAVPNVTYVDLQSRIFRVFNPLLE